MGEARGGESYGECLETFRTQLETQLNSFYFFTRNPLKSPDSDK